MILRDILAVLLVWLLLGAAMGLYVVLESLLRSRPAAVIIAMLGFLSTIWFLLEISNA